MNWDQYYLSICKAVSLNSKCLSRQIGAIIVKDKSIISTGYNGPPRGIPRCDTRSGVVGLCPRAVLNYKSGEGLDICIAGHAERNSIVNAARHGIAIKDSIMYMTCSIPCSPCLVEIINSGIREIVVSGLTFYDKMGSYLIKESGLKVRQYII